MDITQELQRLAVSNHLTAQEQDLVRHAIQVLQAQQTSLANIPTARWDQAFFAIVGGLVARRSMTDIQRKKLLHQARRLAQECIETAPAQPVGEDS